MNLERIISILIAILRIHPLCQGSQGVGQFIVGLHFGTFLGSQFPLARNIFECLVNVHGTGTMVEQCAAGIELRLDRSQHIVNGGHFNDCFTELFTVTSVRQPFVVGGLGQTHRLRSDTQTRPVHQRHYILDQAHASASAKFSLRVFVHQFAGRTSVNTQFVFDTTDVHATIPLVIDKHRQSTSISSAFFRTGQH